MSWWCICKDLHPSLILIGVSSDSKFPAAEFRQQWQFSERPERSLSCLNSCAPLSLGVGFCRRLLVLKSSAPLGSNMCVYTQSNRNGVQSMVAISPNSQLPGFLIAGILVAIKTVIASTISYAWFLAGELHTKVSVVCFESVDLVFLIQIPKYQIRAEIQRAIRSLFLFSL